MLKIFFTGCIVLAVCSVRAQEPPCADWPADCPDKNSIEVSQSVAIRLDNGLLPSEVEEQDKIRPIITTLLQEVGGKLHWRLTQMEEITGLAGFQKASTPPNLRSPRGIEFYFQFVASEDSLKSWRTWKMHDLDQRTVVGNNAGQSYNDVVNSPLFKSYVDSSNHYRDLYIAYMDKHKNDGASILTDKTPEHYSKKMNEFSDKAVALQTQNIEHNGWKDLENEGKLISHRFRNTAIVYVHIAFNAYYAEINDEVNRCSDYVANGATIAKQAKINEEENGYYHEFGKWDNMIVVLLGNWLNKKVNGSYQAGFTMNGQNDDRSPKKISSDKIQNIAIHIMGNKANAEKIAKLLDLQKLNNVIYKN